MLRREDGIRMRHMLDAAHEALEITQEKVREDLEEDRVLSLALVRLLEVIGEAAARVSEEGRSRNQEVPWSQIVGLRNRLIHGYDAVDMDILWKILRNDLPVLVKQLELLLGEEFET